ncbi:MAG: DUF2442 domain-containing protein [Clostridiales bacterium]|jgi:hypothetical protein|nr:DUF2442 domain-containing protein [Clostridiales bacterium]
MGYWPEVLQVIPTEDYKVYIYFDDGTIRLYDASELVKFGVFRQLTENGLFMKGATVLNSTLAWTLDGSYNPETCLDLCPDTLYAECPIVDEPGWLFKNYEESLE